MSLRYLGLDNWEGLLRRYAELTSIPYARYQSRANGHNPRTAGFIAEEF